jgi:hypothetical protein
VRPIKRLLVFAAEAGVFTVAFVLSFTLADLLDSGAAFLLGLLLSIATFVVIRRRTRPWKIEYDAIGFALSRAERRTHPTRAKYKRGIGRILIWVPTFVAALVLFFFPVASHLRHPSSRYLPNYLVPVPWNFTVFSFLELSSKYGSVTALGRNSGAGRLGLTPAGSREPLSVMSFGSFPSDFLSMSVASDRMREAASHGGIRSEFRLGDVALSCWQYEPPPRRGWVAGLGLFAFRDFTGHFWQIECEAPADVHGQRFSASFTGREEDVPAFYKVLEGVTAVE